MSLRNGKELRAKEKQGEEKAVVKNKEKKKDDESIQLMREYKPTIIYLTKLKRITWMNSLVSSLNSLSNSILIYPC